MLESENAIRIYWKIIKYHLKSRKFEFFKKNVNVCRKKNATSLYLYQEDFRPGMTINSIRVLG